MKRYRRGLFATGGLTALFLALALLIPGSPIGYLAQQGWYQAELLAGREPIDAAIASGRFRPDQVDKLKLVPEIKEYGRSIGLSASSNYDTINPDWDKTIWNLSACDPVRFRSKTWWFPVVGTMPYLGYFRLPDATERADALRLQGYDVYVRTAGAYSTLGWFRDPLLPQMLDWPEQALADTLLHELAHATLWIPGSVQFNESFANFVGEQASFGYLEHKYGPDSDPVKIARGRAQDRVKFRDMLHGVYTELDTVYTQPKLRRGERLVRKQAILATLVTRTAGLDLHEQALYVHSVRSGQWNNARLVQFRTYNRSHDWFAALLAQEDGDLRRFIDRLAEVTAGASDPYAALAIAVGVDAKTADEER
jgi:predicted aminopeptidase